MADLPLGVKFLIVTWAAVAGMAAWGAVDWFAYKHRCRAHLHTR